LNVKNVGVRALYSSATLIFLKALTPVHVGTGREEALHVDLPVQRDEFGFPTIWASSLKGAIKANIRDEKIKIGNEEISFRKLLGSDPGELETTPSHIAFLDAKLLLIPARSLDNVWIYVTTPHLLEYLNIYLSIFNEITGSNLSLDLSHIINYVSQGVAITSRVSEKSAPGSNVKIIVNETEIQAVYDPDIVKKIKLDAVLQGVAKDVLDDVASHGIVIVPDKDDRGLAIIRRSMMMQYRVRLKRETKTVDTGPWSEEYLPLKTVLVSVALCRDAQGKSGEKVLAKDLCKKLRDMFSNKSIYVGGKETIGRGLVKIYMR
jgi:CRISPR-associated protein Cmr4